MTNVFTTQVFLKAYREKPQTVLNMNVVSVTSQILLSSLCGSSILQCLTLLNYLLHSRLYYSSDICMKNSPKSAKTTNTAKKSLSVARISWENASRTDIVAASWLKVAHSSLCMSVSLKGVVHPSMKIQTLYTHPNADERSSEVFYSTKHC